MPRERNRTIAAFALLTLSGCALSHGARREDGSVAETAVIDALDVEDVEDVEDVTSGEPGEDVAMDVAVDAGDVIDVAADIEDVVDASDASDVPALDVTCVSPLSNCGGTCVDLRSDVGRCGACDRACATPIGASGTACVASVCAPRCPTNVPLLDDTEPGVGACATVITARAESCPGQPLSVLADRASVVVGTAMGRMHNHQGSGPCNFGGPDLVFDVVAPANGVLTVDVMSASRMGVYVNSGACSGAGSTQAACSTRNIDQPSLPVRASTLVNAGQHYYVIVDSNDVANAGVFALTVRHASACGGATFGALTCADNGSMSNACTPACVPVANLESGMCPGVTAPGLVVGDRAITVDGNTSGGFTNTLCGEETQRSRVYVVETATPRAVRVEVFPRERGHEYNLAVRSDCGSNAGERCNIVLADTSGERVDYGTAADALRRSVIVGSGNNHSNGFTLRFTPALCGDGLLGPNEVCDDGNTAAGDGCEANCTVPSTCVVQESATDSNFSTPLVAPAACMTTRFDGTVRRDGGDGDQADFFSFDVVAGEEVLFQTFTSPTTTTDAPGICPNGVDTVVEIYGPSTTLSAAPGHFSCGGSNVPLLCVDDATTYCAEAAFTAPATGTYKARLFRYNSAGGTLGGRYSFVVTRRRAQVALPFQRGP